MSRGRAGGRAPGAPRAGEEAHAGGRGWPAKPGSGVRAGSAARAPPSSSANAGGGNGRADVRGFPFGACLTKGTSPPGSEARVSLPIFPFLSVNPLPFLPALSSSSPIPPQGSKRLQIGGPAKCLFFPGADYCIFSLFRYRVPMRFLPLVHFMFLQTYLKVQVRCRL